MFLAAFIINFILIIFLINVNLYFLHILKNLILTIQTLLFRSSWLFQEIIAG